MCTCAGLVVFPVFGLLLGLVTNWISLMIIFEPVDPIRLCGRRGCIVDEGKSKKEGQLLYAEEDDAEFGEIKASISADENHTLSVNGDERVKKKRRGGWLLHGLFLRRQKEVAAVYSRVTSQKVLTMDRFVHAILTGHSVCVAQFTENSWNHNAFVTHCAYSCLHNSPSSSTTDPSAYRRFSAAISEARSTE